MLSYRKQTIQVYWLVVFWCCRRVQSPNGLRSRQKIEKTLHDPTPLTKQTNNGFQKNQETPSWSPHTKMNSLYLERMNSLVYILSWCFLRSVSDNCRHFSVYRIKNCKHTRIHRIACEQKHNARYTFSKACCGCWKLWYRRGGFDDFDSFWSTRKRKYEKPI